MHRAALAHFGINGEYEACDVDPTGFREATAALRRGDLDGANVTMPHKALAYESCDVRSEVAERAGAVNTMSRDDDRVHGDNTDVLGIRAAWQWSGLPGGGAVTIVGAGGAAAAALVALEGRRIDVMARDAAKARSVIDRTGVAARVVPWGVPPIEGVIVNATPIGMAGESFGERVLDQATGMLDMAYRDTETPAVTAMRASGRPAGEGLDMLVGQAVASFEIWTGLAVDPDVMRSAARAELARRRAGSR
jgi:shikimate dehydrogenase